MPIDLMGPNLPGRRERRGSGVIPRALLAAVLVLVAGCNSTPSPTKPHTDDPDTGGSPASDFHLLDVNPASPRHDEGVSPRDYLGRISAWYFGHST
jgi:hypothetical protein